MQKSSNTGRISCSCCRISAADAKQQRQQKFTSADYNRHVTAILREGTFIFGRFFFWYINCKWFRFLFSIMRLLKPLKRAPISQGTLLIRIFAPIHTTLNSSFANLAFLSHFSNKIERFFSDDLLATSHKSEPTHVYEPSVSDAWAFDDTNPLRNAEIVTDKEALRQYEAALDRMMEKVEDCRKLIYYQFVEHLKSKPQILNEKRKCEFIE